MKFDVNLPLETKFYVPFACGKCTRKFHKIGNTPGIPNVFRSRTYQYHLQNKTE